MKQISLLIRWIISISIIAHSVQLFGQAELPLNRTTWNAGAPTGWTDNGTGSYTSSFGCTGNNSGKLDDTGDYYQIYFDSAPDELTFKLKSASMSGGSTLTVEESSNGSDWSTIDTYLDGDFTDCNDITKSLNSASRYVKFSYVKDAGNCVLDDVSITKAAGSVANPTDLTIANITSDKMRITWTKPSGVYNTDWHGVIILVTDEGSHEEDVTEQPGQMDGVDYNANLDYTSAGDYYGSTFSVTSYCVANQTTDSDGDIIITGLTPDNTYRVVAYTYKTVATDSDNDEWSSGASEIDDVAEVQEITSFTTTAGNEETTLSWTVPSGISGTWWDKVVIVARAGSAVEADVNKSNFDGLVDGSVTTSNDWSSIAAADVFDQTSVGTDNTNYFVYNGTSNTVTISNLTNGTDYYYKAMVYYENESSADVWSTGVTANATPSNVTENCVIINEYNDGGGASGTVNGIDLSDEWVELYVVDGPQDMRNWYVTDEEWTSGLGEGVMQIGTNVAFSAVSTGTFVVLVNGSGSDDLNDSDNLLVLYTDNANLTMTNSFNLGTSGDGIALITDDDATPFEKDAGEIPIDYVSFGSEKDVPTGLTWNTAISGTEDEDAFFVNGSNYNNDNVNYWVANAENGGGTTARTPGGYNPGQTTNPVQWDGSSDTDWNTAENWNMGIMIPNDYMHVTIPSAPANQPIVGDNLACYDLTVEAGSNLTIDATYTLTVNGDFMLESDATGQGSLIENGDLAVTGTTTTQLYLTGSNGSGAPNGRMWYISAPTSTATANVFAPLSAGNYNKLWSHTQGNTQYTQITATGTDLTEMKGFVVRPWENTTFTFTGDYNSGNQGTNNNCPVTEGETKEGWNLIGNPYPSAIDWATGTGISLTNVYNTIVFRTGDVGSRTFNTYNGVGGIGTDFGGTNAGIIPPMQGFWVKVNGTTTGGIELENTCRTHNSQSLYKNNEEVDFPVIRLQVSDNTQEIIDPLVIYFNENASDDFDEYDSHKFNTSQTHIYTELPIEGKIVINGMNLTDLEQKIIPIGFATDKNDLFTIKANSIANFDLNTAIYLEDTQTGSIIQLTNGAEYTFQSDVNDGVRFNLFFGDAFTQIESTKTQTTNIYGFNKSVYIYNVTEISDAVIRVYDIAGKLLVEKIALNQKMTEIPVNETGLYIVEVITDNTRTIEKVSLY